MFTRPLLLSLLLALQVALCPNAGDLVCLFGLSGEDCCCRTEAPGEGGGCCSSEPRPEAPTEPCDCGLDVDPGPVLLTAAELELLEPALVGPLEVVTAPSGGRFEPAARAPRPPPPRGGPPLFRLHRALRL